MKNPLIGGSGNLKGSRVTRLPKNMDPATAGAALEHAEEFGFRVRDLIERGHSPRNAIEIALKNTGMYEILKKREGAMERIFAYFEGEVARLKTARDSKGHLGIKRGVALQKGKIEINRDAIVLGADGKPIKKASNE